MEKFKLGDKVRLKKDLPIRDYNGVTLSLQIKCKIDASIFVPIISVDHDNTVKVRTADACDFWVGEDALELYQEDVPIMEPNNKILTTQKIQNNEIRFQKPKASSKRGVVPAGSTISGRKDKIAISIGHLSYQVCNC